MAHDSGDCSDRKCPYELAWVDSPDRHGKFHKYAECGGRGTCDRSTGECNCFDGYEGKGCARTTCPNQCSGHGTCEFIEDFAYGAVWNDYSVQHFNSDPKTFALSTWDAGKTRGCVCDALYGDADCSKRMCPYGNDVLDIREDYSSGNPLMYQVQTLRFVNEDIGVDPRASANNRMNGRTFALTFKSKLNETFTTIPIVWDFEGGDSGTGLQDTRDDFVQDVQLALLNLPNRVIDGVSVSMAAAATVAGSSTQKYVDLKITFTGQSVQGKQHPLTVEDYECSNGCTPKLTGLPLQYRYAQATSNSTETSVADYNSYECGRRGKCDYDTGLCECFAGYTGENCNQLTTLV
jgi:hypothetical protein